jgi:hypothetical protein
MRRGLAVALLGLITVAGGCGTPARFVEKQGESGIVAIPSNTNNWPSYNRREALALIQQHIGPNYEIIDEREVVTGQSTVTNTHANAEQHANKRFPGRVAVESLTSTSTTTQQDVKEYRIWYRRTAGQLEPLNEQPYGGIRPVGGVQPGPAPGVVPSVQPGAALQNVGNPPQRWTSGTGSHTMPNVRSAGGPACDH